MPPKPRPVEDRFFEKVRIEDNGCWIWIGCKSPEGYARLNINNYPAYAHRWAYQKFVGPLTPGLTLDHLCRVRHCVNPKHLEEVTVKENTLRGESQAAKRAQDTHCIHGHLYDEANTRINKNGSRSCRTCQREHARKRARERSS